jgi:hypothetical protein
MEKFTANIPTDWTSPTPSLISKVTTQGRVHTGLSAVSLEDGAVLTQSISDINPGCFYEFSFFAHGEGAQVSVTATVTFHTLSGNVQGGSIFVESQDIPNSDRDFGYYRVITIAAPDDVTSATIEFDVSASGDQALDLDDVSLR